MRSLSFWIEWRMLSCNVELLHSWLVFDAGIRHVRDPAGTAGRGVGLDVCMDFVAIHLEAVASEHGLSSGDWWLHRNCGY